MGAALRPSSPPAALPLRAKFLGRIRNERRQHAREYGAKSLWRSARSVADAELGRFSERASDDGACVRSGAIVLTAAEVALLLPRGVAIDHLVDCIKERIARDLIIEDSPEVQLRLRLALTHIEAMRTILT